MIKKFKDLDFNNETFQTAINSIQRVQFKRACNSPKYLVIDWKDVEVNEDFIESLKSIDMELIQEYFSELEYINNVDVLLEAFKLIDSQWEDEATLYNYLVPEFVGNDLYVLLTYEENFNLLMKTVNFEEI